MLYVVVVCCTVVLHYGKLGYALKYCVVLRVTLQYNMLWELILYMMLICIVLCRVALLCPVTLLYPGLLGVALWGWADCFVVTCCAGALLCFCCSVL